MSTQAKGVCACGALAFSLLSMCLLQPSISPSAKSMDESLIAGEFIETTESEETKETAGMKPQTDNREIKEMALKETEYFSAGMASILNEGEKAREDAEAAILLESGGYFTFGMAAIMHEGAEARAAVVRVVPDVDKALNIRTEPSEESPIAGKFYRGCVGEQMETADGWIKIRSGAVTGWVSAGYVKTGEEADRMIAETDPVMITVNTDTLNVRREAGTDSDVLAVISRGQTFMAGEADGEWIEILYTPDITGYVAAGFVTVEKKAGEAVDIETINRYQKEAAEKEAQRKAKEKKRQIAITTGSPMLASVDDVTLLAAVCQYEAGSSYEGCLAVANVVLNRVRSGSYPGSIAEVIYAPGQFGSVRAGALNRFLAGGIGSNARRAASDALAGINNIGGYTTFCSARIANVNAYSSYVMVGGNCFYAR